MLALCAGLTLSGCSSPTPDTSAAPEAGTSDFCEEFEANGGGGATIAPLQITSPKEDLVASITEQLDAMADLEPPADIAEAWAEQKSYLEGMLETANGLPDGGALGAADTVPTDPGTYQAIVDYYFDNCA